MLFIAAVLPVFLLCFFVYMRDTNKEPIGLLLEIFFSGFLSAVPVGIVEMVLGIFFSTEMSELSGFIQLFINVFIGVALVEEIFKWLVVKSFGYDNREFDEVYDIIVYSVFSSLGFACIENVLYVIGGGMGVAISRALLSIPGHMCFGVLMGYYFAQAKLASINNDLICKKNLILSVLVPCIFHTIYDSLLFFGETISIIAFFLFDIAMVIYCIVIIIRVSKVQNNVKVNITSGAIVKNNNGVAISETYQEKFAFCPICGNPSNGANFCSKCGMKLIK